MDRLAYLESISRTDDEFVRRFIEDVNIMQKTKQLQSAATQTPQVKRRYAKEIDREPDYASLAINTYIALNPYLHPVARLNAGLNVVEELTTII